MSSNKANCALYGDSGCRMRWSCAQLAGRRGGCTERLSRHRWACPVALFVALGLTSWPAWADYQRGVRDAAQGDYQGARREYFEAARDGNDKAQNNLARLYRQGLGGPIDLERAFFWFSKAAQSGQVNAQTSLGDMFENGEAVPLNYPVAAYWYRRAATSGFFIGQISLAEMLKVGKGIPQDRVAALAWYTIASRTHVNPANQYYVEESAKATEGRDDLAHVVSESERVAAEDLATRWVVGYDLPEPQRPITSSAEANPPTAPSPKPSEVETVVATGTGFVINGRGDVVTNNHVIAGCTPGQLRIEREQICPG
jgi:hypothetical protein